MHDQENIKHKKKPKESFMSLCELYTEAITATKACIVIQFIAGILCRRIYLRFALGLNENELHIDNHSTRPTNNEC